VALPGTPVAGNCDNGAWRIGYTFGTVDGETELGPLSAVVTIADKTTNGKIAASNIAIGGSAVLWRKAYAIPPAGGNPKFAALLNNNTATIQTIDIAASALGAEAPTVNTTADPELVGLIVAVRERAELATNRAIPGPQTFDLILEQFPRDGYIEIPKPPLVSVTSVKYVDTAGATQTMDPSLYLVQAPAGPRCARGRVALPFAAVWPITLRQMGAVTVRFVCGYGAAAAVPALLKSAMKLDIGTLYANREGVVLGGRQAAPDELPMGVRAIYFSYRSWTTQRLREGWAA
jgi:uncharacterized phiE125 gp8 family phage protein